MKSTMIIVAILARTAAKKMNRNWPKVHSIWRKRSKYGIYPSASNNRSKVDCKNHIAKCG